MARPLIRVGAFGRVARLYAAVRVVCGGGRRRGSGPSTARRPSYDAATRTLDGEVRVALELIEAH
jgi:hypothetical protein